jgi:hypothetical protein
MSTRNGTARAEEPRVHAHRGDPDASIAAAEYQARNSSRNQRVKDAILGLLAEEPRTSFELQDAYFSWRMVNDWPDVQVYSINRRLSDLHNAGLVRAVVDGEGTQLRRPSPAGATATVWERVPEQQDARAAA